MRSRNWKVACLALALYGRAIDASAAGLTSDTGGQSGATALLYWYPHSQVAVALMTNLDGRAIDESFARKIASVAAAPLP
jgi:hypothetical protein